MRPPSWLDLRLVLGIALVLASVVGGALALSSADHRQSRWAITRDLAAGTVLSGSDVRAVRVQLGPADHQYLSVTEPVVGRALQSPVQSGQLLPRSVLVTPTQGVAVTIPLRPDNGPAIARGDRITVWLSTKSCQGQVLLSGVPVQSVARSADASFGSDTGSVLVVELPGTDARRVVAALDLDSAVIRAGVLSSGQPADPVAADLTGCGGGHGG
ncbi:MAG: SAF domain-containing protein [Jatrophihabitantaceae bacterium]